MISSLSIYIPLNINGIDPMGMFPFINNNLILDLKGMDDETVTYCCCTLYCVTGT
ncbi:hypothetical protein VCHA50P417_150019 [Vibrio chagasii]|nr:hypothetical protein VCHA34P120_150091 [Vibrio chagasii]CAH6858041.1 hypothetical protein VCHA35O143_210091 [Vibrio chagasii]CAH6884650.1 hypothetical protein VCHA34P112_20248 [Vibrio chagasii]CAH6893341.1 hypothetical protein VCHA37P193_100086 [Vibrio chagasii]CAH6911854.1 hypothetical protein VCHA40P240_100141 [Vibrio chagasii]